MVATQDQRLSAVILKSGAYNFFTWYPTAIDGINKKIFEEAGTSTVAFRDRSTLYHADKIRSSVCILHGGKDDRMPVKQAQDFSEKLKGLGVVLKVRIYPDAGHNIPIKEQLIESDKFLEEHLW